MRSNRGVVTALVAVVMLSVTGTAPAALPQQSGGLDLLTQAQGRVDGATAGDVLGENLAGAGDVNGDGIGDVILGSGTRNATVVFGNAAFGTLDSAALGSRGFRIVNSPTTYPYHVVSGAGDQNGDGKADVLIGEETTNKAYLIFGKADTATVNPSSLGAGGVTFTGATGTPSVGVATDMNGDGKPEVLVSDQTATFSARATAGITYVIFGGAFAGGTSIALSTVGGATPGFQIGGPVAGHNTGSQIAGAGDFNGDGKGDVLVADESAGNNGRGGSGSVYVVYGKSTTTAVDLNAAGPLRIDGQLASDGLGRSLSPAGDVNGDGRADVVVGASFADNAGSSSGSAWVVFGSAAPPATLDTATITGASSAGYRIDGVASGDQAGRSLGGGGDVNGDGKPDIVIGSLFADPLSRADAGAFYVVYGKSTPSTVALGSLGSAGFHVDAAVAGDTLGRGVAMVG
ncbi:MAG: hypothetical protein JWM73_1040, partial [Solirubrobacterales bacterium]|nr:hypothetical protein [Solirubrobacterales bacterium]